MDWVGSLGKSAASPAGRVLFGWLAGFRLSQTLALRAYQRRLAKRHGTFTPASGPSAEPLPMREMYLVLPLVLSVLGIVVILANLVVVLPGALAVDMGGWWLFAALWVLNLAGPAVAAFVLLHNRKAARSPLRAAVGG